MALSRVSNGTSLMGGSRFGNNRENMDGLLGKAVSGKPRLNSATARTALGNISNRNFTGTVSLKNKEANKENATVKPRLQKSAGTSSLQAVVEKENPVAPIHKVKKEVEAPAPASPMDISQEEVAAEVAAFSKQQLSLPPNVLDIDREDHDNPQLVSEYVNDIYQYMRDLETAYPINHRYLEGTDLNGRMRAILVDWLVQVHLRFHLLQETLYLTVAIIDRFLQVQPTSRNKLQLVGVTAMLIASKYEEMYAPEVNDFVYITDNAYTKEEIRRMECLMLKTLDFNLGRPLPLHFLRRNSKAGEVDANKHTLAKYLMELTIVDYDMCHIKPSQIAAAALCLSMKVLDDSEWSETLSFYSAYPENELTPVMAKMAKLVTKAGTGKQTAIKAKYQSTKFIKISLLPELKSKVITDLAASAE